MKKMVKGLGLSLCAMLLLTGCSCKKDEDNDTTANITNPNDSVLSGLKEGVTSVTLEEVYNDLKATYGNDVAAQKLLKTVYDLVVLNDPVWKGRYNAKVDEKLAELEKNSKYQDSKGIFNEELLVKTLNSEDLYNVTCTNNTYGPTYKQNGDIETYRLCDYTNYVEKELKLDIVKEILNEKYIYDKVIGADNKNVLTTKKSRLVEYISIDYKSDDIASEEEAIAFIKENIDLLDDDNSTLTLKNIADKWTAKKLEEVQKKYDSIGTKDDKDGKNLQDFTNKFTQDKSVGLRQKREAVNNTKYYDEVYINSDNKSILNSTLVERILSEDVVSEGTIKTKNINGSYYLVAPQAYQNITSSDIRIKDASNSRYYIIKVTVINNESKDDLKYEAVKVLATNTNLVSDSLEYYLEQYKDKIKVYDEEVYNYLKLQYKDIFTD